MRNESIDQLRRALQEFIDFVEHSDDPQLKITVDAYVDQVYRILDLLEHSPDPDRDTDTYMHIIAAQRWLWKIAKNCALYGSSAGGHA